MGEVSKSRKKAARKSAHSKNPSVVFCCSEVAPFSKTGGLGDVCGTLPKALAKLGIDIRVFSPLYKCVREHAKLEDTGITVRIPIGLNVAEARVYSSLLPDSNVPVYFFENDHYYNRNGLYGDGYNDYRDNCERYTFFCRSVLEAIEPLGLSPDIIHCNDWQTGLIPVYLSKIYRHVSEQYRAKSIMTLHNINYQGNFWHLDVPLLGLGWDIFNWRELESNGMISFLKGGIVFSDAINTVSPAYATEIQDHKMANGLGSVLINRSKDLFGILNGIDTREWDPAKDSHIAANYSVGKLKGKGPCKSALQKKLGLVQSPDRPIVAIVSRLADEKGIELITSGFHALMGMGIQFVVLGSGDPYYHWTFDSLLKDYPDRMAVHIGFNEELAHNIYAGADIFLMPSRIEACGLSQLYCFRYGVAPVARGTGGLLDTVINYNGDNLDNGEANGFTFDDYTTDALCSTVRRALDLYSNKVKWRKLMRNGMRRDFSWDSSAREYAKFYNKVTE